MFMDTIAWRALFVSKHERITFTLIRFKDLKFYYNMYKAYRAQRNSYLTTISADGT